VTVADTANEGYPRIKIVRKTGCERFYLHGRPLELSLLDFWQWSRSDLLSNATRGVLAEYIVASALGLTRGVRGEWDASVLDKRCSNQKTIGFRKLLKLNPCRVKYEEIATCIEQVCRETTGPASDSCRCDG
jgi:hypothetical protein